ncbi:MAG: AP2 domain-containing protein [Clostridiaceae bacterium]|nr:AP2 domain-containing protein [Clostridiaceae bacterium]
MGDPLKFSRIPALLIGRSAMCSAGNRSSQERQNRMSKPKIAAGYRCGKLEVVESTAERKSRYIVWRCRCDCGKDIFLDTRCLQRGTIRDCGCSTKVKPGQRDITGMRFGLLTPIEPASTQKPGYTIWHCKCDCGGEIDVPLSQLTSGYRKSCGCLSHPPLKDYIGRRFGKLTVIGYAGKHGGMHRWKCVCECGNETIVGQTLLQSGKTKSCGCLKSTSILDTLKLCDGTSVTILETTKKHLFRTNKSGYTGVYQNKKTGKWVAQITFKRKTYYLGTYNDLEDAVKARKSGEEKRDDFLEWYYSTWPDQQGATSKER